MKRIAFLMVFIMLFGISCAKKAENKMEAPLESETIAPETTGPVTLEAQPQGTTMTTKEGMPVEMGRDALAPQIPQPVDAMGASENLTPENIQIALKNAGLYTGSIDGKIGPKTKKAIEAFQKQNGLTADGKVGPKTWDKLKSYLNKVSDSAPINN